ncbi:glutathione S-transferase [Sporothrix brasiliensis 5110]|uniref:Glutathione S-transferase n=1 Tax=Sporothrix brasiliensis 5110 TaxID=1398154 RepID=A0A0C2F499_9PEZI|nr:glutathione S-transferase [Sporothrix brasiliensis 5110]KIH93734.1 glutathione S-transferase [Sporothrix brasiliensis 5110]
MTTTTSYQAADGSFVRPDSEFRQTISSEPGARYPPEKGRYALYFAPGCPWAHRTLIVRKLKGLDDIVDLYQLHSFMGPEGWYFSGEGGSLPKDPLYGFTKLKELYFKANPNYTGRYTVPVLWDKKTGTLVNNESSEIIRILASAFDSLLPEARREANQPGGGLYPAAQRAEIDALNDWVYATVNNGVYKIGFATAQAAYDEHVPALFASLDRLEAQLAAHGKPFLLGDALTEADVRLYTTLVRFDSAYAAVFQCTLRSIRHDYPHLHLWLRCLYWDGAAVRDQTRGAFHATTAPYIGHYIEGYARSRHKVVFKEQGPLIIPTGPAQLIEPLPKGED